MPVGWLRLERSSGPRTHSRHWVGLVASRQKGMRTVVDSTSHIRPSRPFGHSRHRCRIGLIALALVAFSAGGASEFNVERMGLIVERPMEGFGASTEGGANGTPYVVTNLNNDGPGTLRDAISQSNRYVTFDVGGTIELASGLYISEHHITVDGSTAPEPGITLVNRGLGIATAGTDTAHDVIVRHIRIAGAGDNLSIAYGAHDIVIDHCSFRRALDGNVDIFDGAHDLTIQWCIIGNTHKNSLIRDNVWNVSLHHNLYVHGGERNPQVQVDCLVVDVVNNTIYDWDPTPDDWGGDAGYGTRFRASSTGNLIKNAYVPSDSSDRARAIILTSSTQVYTEDNVVPEESDGTGTTDTRWAAPPVTEMPPWEAVAAVLAEAGAFPRDSEDSSYVADVIGDILDAAGDPPQVGQPFVSALPNPFRFRTTLVYMLPVSGPVRLAIYDAQGRRILGLRDRWEGAGRHEISWGRLDETGNRVSPGVYFVRLESTVGDRAYKLVVTQ